MSDGQTFEYKLQQWIPSRVNKFDKLTANRAPYLFDAWSANCLRYRFLKKDCVGYNRKRVFIDEIEAAIGRIGSNGYFDRSDFKIFCPKTNRDGPCGYCVIGRIMETLGMAVYSPKEHRFNLTGATVIPTSIRYNVSKSKFVEPLKKRIDEQRNTLESGETIIFRLPEDLCEDNGYSGRVILTIQPARLDKFDTEWIAVDISRFPARIKAVATALRDLRFTGKFEICHAKGEFQIKVV